jgi:hypothetical protein
MLANEKEFKFMEDPVSSQNKSSSDTANPAVNIPTPVNTPGKTQPISIQIPGSALNDPSPLLSVGYLTEKLEAAELLMAYAAEVGIKIDDEVRNDVLKARVAAENGGLSETIAAKVLTALTALAVTVRPVTVESLQSWANPSEGDKGEIPFLAPVAILISCIIVIFSLLTFVSKSISDKITTDIGSANELASKLRAELGPSPALTNLPPAAIVADNYHTAVPLQDQVWFGPAGIPPGLSDKDVISDLQQFAATVREIDGYSRQLKHCLLNFTQHYYSENGTNRVTLELAPGLNVRLSQQLTDMIAEYQQVRSFGNQLVEKVTVYYGAIAISILPVLYALLGAVAYLLRSYGEQSKSRTLIISEKPIARLVIAGIGGLVVGQFNNVTQGINITPFAVAFLVGYAVDVFFTFLEGLLQMFVKRGPGHP